MDRFQFVKILRERYEGQSHFDAYYEGEYMPIIFISEITRLYEDNFEKDEVEELEEYFSILRKAILKGDDDVREIVALGVIENYLDLTNWLKIAYHYLGDIEWFINMVKLQLDNDEDAFKMLVVGKGTEDWW